MKKVISILLISMVTLVVIAQENFTVPNLTDTQKYQIAAAYWRYTMLMALNIAKSSGKSIEEAATYGSDQNKIYWDKEAGFKGLVEGILTHYVILVPDGNVEIIEQTDKMIKIKITNFYPELKAGPILNVTYEELITYLQIANSRLADYMGATFSFKDTPEGIITIIQKK